MSIDKIVCEKCGGELLLGCRKCSFGYTDISEFREKTFNWVKKRIKNERANWGLCLTQQRERIKRQISKELNNCDVYGGTVEESWNRAIEKILKKL